MNLKIVIPIFHIILIITALSLFPIEIYADTTAAQIEELKSQLKEIEIESQKRINELQKRIEGIGARTKAEDTSNQIITGDGGKKEDQTSKNQSPGNIKAGYDDGLYFETLDQNYKLRMRIFGQFQFLANDTDGENTSTNFEVRRLRLQFIGNAFRKWFRYYIQLGVDKGDFELLDAYFDFAYDTRAVPRIGKYRVPFNREELNATPRLLLVERSIVNREFTYGRQPEGALFGQLGSFITYGFGAYNGDGLNGNSTDSNLLYVGRIQLDPCCGTLSYNDGIFPSGGDYSLAPNFGKKDTIITEIGLAGAAFPGLNTKRKDPSRSLVNRFNDIGITDGNVYSVTMDFLFKYNRFNIEGEYNSRWINSEDINGSVFDQGYRIQSGFFLIQSLLEVAGRVAYIDFDNNTGTMNNEWEITPGMNIYFSKNHNWKLQLNYTFIRENPTGEGNTDSNIFSAQFQSFF